MAHQCGSVVRQRRISTPTLACSCPSYHGAYRHRVHGCASVAFIVCSRQSRLQIVVGMSEDSACLLFESLIDDEGAMPLELLHWLCRASSRPDPVRPPLDAACPTLDEFVQAVGADSNPRVVAHITDLLSGLGGYMPKGRAVSDLRQRGVCMRASEAGCAGDVPNADTDRAVLAQCRRTPLTWNAAQHVVAKVDRLVPPWPVLLQYHQQNILVFNAAGALLRRMLSCAVCLEIWSECVLHCCTYSRAWNKSVPPCFDLYPVPSCACPVLSLAFPSRCLCLRC